jgi:hypothetical protein
MSLFELLSKFGYVVIARFSLSDLGDLFALTPEVYSVAEAVDQSLSGDVEISSYLGNGVTGLAVEDALQHHSQQVALLLCESKEFRSSLECLSVSLCSVRAEELVQDGLEDEMHLRLQGLRVGHEDRQVYV